MLCAESLAATASPREAREDLLAMTQSVVGDLRYLRKPCEINCSDSDCGSESTGPPPGPDVASGWSSLANSQPPTPPPIHAAPSLVRAPISPPPVVPPYVQPPTIVLDSLEASARGYMPLAFPPPLSPSVTATAMIQGLPTPPPRSMPPLAPPPISVGVSETPPPPPPTFAPSLLLPAPPGLAPVVTERCTTSSVGSAQHGSGDCRPCAWFWKPQGCQNGGQCRHCHMCPEGELKMRKRTKVANMAANTDPDTSNALNNEKQLPFIDDVETVHVAALDTQVGPLESPNREGGLEHALATNAETDCLVPRTGAKSRGSAFHGTGECQPCAWFWKPQGCQNGADCGRCHQCPEGEVKRRKKMKLAALRVDISRVEGEEALVDTARSIEDDEDQCHADLASSDPAFDASARETTMPLPMSIDGGVELMQPPGLPRIGESCVGSERHNAGVCKPCAWYWKPQGCQNGKECHYCHACLEGEVKSRRKARVVNKNS